MQAGAAMSSFVRGAGKLILIIAYVGLIALIVPLSLWLLLTTQTWAGAGIAVIGLAAGVLPVTCLLWLKQRTGHRLWGWSSLALGCIGAGTLGLVLLSTPDGRPPPDSPVQHRYTGSTVFRRYTLANVVPEADQVRLGFLVMPHLDPILTPTQARRVSDFTLDLYREMERDRNFRQLGSEMGWAYTELMGLPFDMGHYYLYVPDNRGNTPLPAIVFLHGSAGNFKAYTWVWSKLAEEHGVAIIAPSFGFGNWQSPDGPASALRALEDAATVTEIDRSMVYLVGLSNGGLGVSRLAQASPRRFRGLVFVSPVMDTGIVDGAPFQTAWRGRPVLVVTGAQDRRVPIAYVERRVSAMKAGGVDVTEVVYSDEDHFLFFSRPESVLYNISNWISAVDE
jgi:pimeloyl-ACP methyl ester carboxylesterase